MAPAGVVDRDLGERETDLLVESAQGREIEERREAHEGPGTLHEETSWRRHSALMGTVLGR